MPEVYTWVLKGAAMFRILCVVAVLLASASVAAGESLFDAVKAGDTASVERLLASGAEIDSRDRDQATPLIAASLSDQPAVAELLLSKGADVMARNAGGFTPLHAAAYSGSVRIAELLLGKGAVLEDAANKAGVTPLMVAVEQNRVAMLELLIARGADVNRPESLHRYTPVTRAGFKGHRDIIRVLKRHGAACPPAEVIGASLCIEMSD
jgi:ankyrin repeat protein